MDFLSKYYRGSSGWPGGAACLGWRKAFSTASMRAWYFAPFTTGSTAALAQSRTPR